MSKYLILFLGMLISNWSYSQLFEYAHDNPIELGKVNWLRDYDQAQRLSAETDKDIFILFQEVPGCSNCTKYGSDIMSHPLLIEAIETEFIPLAIFNNKSGHDREVLLQFGEPTWNNPVVRIVNQKGEDRVKRVGDFRSRAKVVNAMVDALTKNQRVIPKYLDLLQTEWNGQENGSEEAYLSMYCFWTGEKELAKLEGILSTEAGFMHGREVVKFSFDPTKTDLNTISTTANKVKCGDALFTNQKSQVDVPIKREGKYRKDKEDKYYLRHTDYQYVPLTELQKTKINSAVGMRKDPTKYLSPRQKTWLEKGTKNYSFIEQDFTKAWWKHHSD